LNTVERFLGVSPTLGRLLCRPLFWLAVIAAMAMAACADDGAKPGDTLSGTVEVDGSSTVYPITQAMAEEFQLEHRKVRITVGISGTGGGFKRFCGGEIAIANASRAIKDSEKQSCDANGVGYVELFAAFDGLSVVANPRDTFVDCVTVDELKRIWDQGSRVNNWRDIRAGFPDRKLVLFGPGTDSGTFDYFTEAINGTAKRSRSDYTASEDDNALVQGIRGQRGSLGYFGYAYYQENAENIRLLGVDAGKGAGCVKPSKETIQSGQYQPLSRPLFLYVSKDSLAKEQVRAFLDFYLNDQNLELVEAVGYIRGEPARYDEARTALENANLEVAAR
jgi:phosphate transport system substrate-binding protein